MKNNNETRHAFKVIDTLKDIGYGGNGIFPTVDMSISCEAGLSDMLEAFKSFLSAIGYVLPENTYLDFVPYDDDRLEEGDEE